MSEQEVLKILSPVIGGYIISGCGMQGYVLKQLAPMDGNLVQVFQKGKTLKYKKVPRELLNHLLTDSDAQELVKETCDHLYGDGIFQKIKSKIGSTVKSFLNSDTGKNLIEKGKKAAVGKLNETIDRGADYLKKKGVTVDTSGIKNKASQFIDRGASHLGSGLDEDYDDDQVELGGSGMDYDSDEEEFEGTGIELDDDEVVLGSGAGDSVILSSLAPTVGSIMGRKYSVLAGMPPGKMAIDGHGFITQKFKGIHHPVRIPRDVVEDILNNPNAQHHIKRNIDHLYGKGVFDNIKSSLKSTIKGYLKSDAGKSLIKKGKQFAKDKINSLADKAIDKGSERLGKFGINIDTAAIKKQKGNLIDRLAKKVDIGDDEATLGGGLGYGIDLDDDEVLLGAGNTPSLLLPVDDDEVDIDEVFDGEEVPDNENQERPANRNARIEELSPEERQRLLSGYVPREEHEHLLEYIRNPGPSAATMEEINEFHREHEKRGTEVDRLNKELKKREFLIPDPKDPTKTIQVQDAIYDMLNAGDPNRLKNYYAEMQRIKDMADGRYSRKLKTPQEIEMDKEKEKMAGKKPRASSSINLPKKVRQGQQADVEEIDVKRTKPPKQKKDKASNVPEHLVDGGITIKLTAHQKKKITEIANGKSKTGKLKITEDQLRFFFDGRHNGNYVSKDGSGMLTHIPLSRDDMISLYLKHESGKGGFIDIEGIAGEITFNDSATVGRGIDGVSGIVEAGAKAVDSLGNAAEKFGETIDQGRRTTQEIREQQGKNDATRAKYANKANVESNLDFNRFLDKLNDARYHNPGLLPPNLKFSAFDLPGNLTNKLPRFRERKQKADEALYSYAKKEYYG